MGRWLEADRSARAEVATVALVALVVVAVQIALFHGTRLDDAYITYRYAQNIANGAGFVFNPGDRLLGTTAPGDALLGAVGYWLAGRALPSMMAAIGCVGWTAQAVAIYSVLRLALGRSSAAIVALAIAAGAATSFQWTPLETNLVAALIMTGFALAFRARWLAAAIVVGVATVVRGDAVLAMPFVIVLAIAARGPTTDETAATRARSVVVAAWRPALAFVLIVAPWIAFSSLYFGSPLPHTFGAKAGRATVLVWAKHLALRWPLELVPLRPTHGGPLSVAIAIVALVLAAAGGVVLVRRDRRFAAIVGFAAMHLALYAAIRPETSFLWHLYPATLIAATCALASLASISEGTLRILARSLAILAIGMAAWGSVDFARAEPDMLWYGARDAIDREIADYLRARSALTDMVDAEEVGTLAFYSELPMTDHYGLVARDPMGDHRRAFAGTPMPHVRWLVMNRHELDSHQALFQRRTLLLFRHGPWRLWVADLQASNPPAPREPP